MLTKPVNLFVVFDVKKLYDPFFFYSRPMRVWDKFIKPWFWHKVSCFFNVFCLASLLSREAILIFRRLQPMEAYPIQEYSLPVWQKLSNGAALIVKYNNCDTNNVQRHARCIWTDISQSHTFVTRTCCEKEMFKRQDSMINNLNEVTYVYNLPILPTIWLGDI